MLFNSSEYALFLVLFVGAYYGLARTFPAQRALVIVGSAIFYASWSPAFLVHFFAVVALNYAASLWLQRAATVQAKRRVLWIAITADLANLGFWKYVGLALETVTWLARHVAGSKLSMQAPSIVLPLAISFYTFHAISYLVDIYRRYPQSRADSFADFMFYIVMFPHQIAGPILRGHELFPQLGYKPYRGADVSLGTSRLIIGLFQKAVIADNLAIVADHGFAHPGELSAGETYVVLLAYTFQIFFDFAGYTNMGIGSARMLGYRLPENFDTPYLSLDIAEFWRRWHMTLSRWIRDYVFIPLGGSHASIGATHRNLLIAMALAGLWHGASWTFAVWGLYHGAGLVVHRAWTGSNTRSWLVRLVPTRVHRTLGLVVTFHFVALGWVVFRAPNFGSAWKLCRGLWQGLSGSLPWGVDEAFFLKTYGFTAMVLYGLGIGAGRMAGLRTMFERRLEIRMLAWSFVFFLVVLLSPQNPAPFIYFQF